MGYSPLSHKSNHGGLERTIRLLSKTDPIFGPQAYNGPVQLLEDDQARANW